MTRSNVKHVRYVPTTKKWRVSVNKYITDALPHIKSSGTFTHKVDAEAHAREISKAYAEKCNQRLVYLETQFFVRPPHGDPINT